MASKTRILIVDNNDSFTFNLVQLVEESGFTSVEVIGSDLLDPGVVSGFDKVLLSPGPGLPTDFPRMCEVIRHYGPNKNILGICLGHQAIAVGYGGTLINMARVKHGLTAKLHFRVTDNLLFNGVLEGSLVGLYHSWTVDPKTLPDCLEITAVSEQETVLAIRHKTFNIRGLQFHPESFMSPSGKIMINNWLRSA